MVRLHSLVAIALFAALGAHAARHGKCGSNSSDAINTDRLQVTSSSVVVPCGSLQFENGYADTVSFGQRILDVPETEVRLGISGKTEIHIAVPDYFHLSPAPSGFGDLIVGFKQQLGPTKGGFDVSLIPLVSLPTGAKATSSHGYDPTLQIPWSRQLSRNWSTAGMLSVMWLTQGPRRNLTGQASIFMDRQITELWDTYFEYSGNYPQRGGPQNLVDFGTAYRFKPQQVMDLYYGLGLSAAAQDHYFGFGYSVRFQVFRAKV